MSLPSAKPPVVVGLGEVLFDMLPAGPVLGGAPVNAAVHARQLLDRHGPPGARVAVATRVGDDDLGRRIRRELNDRGLDTTAVQVDPERPTGTATVSLVAGSAEFTITPDAAWDHLAGDPAWERLAGEATAVCYGTLGSRSEPSGRAIATFLESTRGAVRLFDVNLRAPFHSPGLIRRLTSLATILKMNEAELPVVADVLGVPPGSQEHRLARCREVAGLEAAILTLGAAGATIVTGEGSWTSPARAFPPAPDADTIGAGDSFCAAVIVGRLLGWPTAQALDLACETAGYVASQPGATPVRFMPFWMTAMMKAPISVPSRPESAPQPPQMALAASEAATIAAVPAASPPHEAEFPLLAVVRPAPCPEPAATPTGGPTRGTAP